MQIILPSFTYFPHGQEYRLSQDQFYPILLFWKIILNIYSDFKTFGLKHLQFYLLVILDAGLQDFIRKFYTKILYKNTHVIAFFNELLFVM